MGFYTESLLIDIIGLVVALCLISYTYIKWRYQYWNRKNVPYLEPKAPFGNLQSPWTREISIGARIRQLYKETRKRGLKHSGIYFTLSPMYLLSDLDYIKNVMTKDFLHFTDRGGYVNEKDEPIAAHLFAIGGLKWRNLRTKLTPTFTSGKMRSMFQTLIKSGEILQDYMIDKVKENEPVDIKSVLTCFSTDIIGSCAFGLDCNTFKEPDSPFIKYSQKIFQATRMRILKNLIVTSFPNLGKRLHITLFPKDVAKFYTKITEDTVNYRITNNVIRKDFLQLLIDLKDNDEHNSTGDGTYLTMNEIVAQSFVFFIAGFETSSTTMTFALYELANNQDVQSKVRKEINDVLQKHDGNVSYDSLNDMKYMTQVINETLRKYPPVPFVTRVCVKDYKIPDENTIIEKGTRVLIPILGIHYDDEYYPNPHEFDPERFSEENKQQRHQYAHLPFGEGPRICIGMRFGIMQTKVGLTYLLKNFKFSLNEKTPYPLKIDKNAFIPRSESTILLNFERI